jgi:chromosome segregation ATPase
MQTKDIIFIALILCSILCIWGNYNYSREVDGITEQLEQAQATIDSLNGELGESRESANRLAIENETVKRIAEGIEADRVRLEKQNQELGKIVIDLTEGNRKLKEALADSRESGEGIADSISEIEKIISEITTE